MIIDTMNNCLLGMGVRWICCGRDLSCTGACSFHKQELLSRLIAHLVPISTVPSGLDKYPTSISVILVLPLSRISVILFLRYSSFHVFSL